MGKPPIPRDPHIDQLYKHSDLLNERAREAARTGADLSKHLSRLYVDSDILVRHCKALAAARNEKERRT